MNEPKLMAEVSSHLRNYNVGETIALIGFLDSHPQIKKRPLFCRGKAVFQQARGTRTNPFAHVLPCNLLIDAHPMSSYFSTMPAKALIEGMFGMGKKAPDDWPALNTFSAAPREQNITDNIAERFSAGRSGIRLRNHRK
jgi:hypothetical protein